MTKSYLSYSGMPEVLAAPDLEHHVLTARSMLEDELLHNSRPTPAVTLPISAASRGGNLLNLKRKFPFLNQYSDEFILASGPLTLIKAETASRKLQEFDRGRKAEDKLLANRESLASTT